MAQPPRKKLARMPMMVGEGWTTAWNGWPL